MVSNELLYKKRDDLRETLNSPGNIESTFIEIIFPNKKNLIFACVYRNPHISVNDFIDNYLIGILAKTTLENKDSILLGDFNIDLLRCNNNNSISKFFETVSSSFLHLLTCVLQPTHITDTSNTLIDNIYLNSIEYQIISGNLTYQIADHLIQFLVLLNYKTFPINI